MSMTNLECNRWSNFLLLWRWRRRSDRSRRVPVLDASLIPIWRRLNFFDIVGREPSGSSVRCLSLPPSVSALLDDVHVIALLQCKLIFQSWLVSVFNNCFCSHTHHGNLETQYWLVSLVVDFIAGTNLVSRCWSNSAVVVHTERETFDCSFVLEKESSYS